MKLHQVSVVIITEKKFLSPYEEISLRRSMDVFAGFNKYLVIPETTNPDHFADTGKLTVIKLHESYFQSVASYSKLLLSESFYKHFTDSEFILIYQLDCFAFHSNFNHFLDFDYVGAPWFNSQNHLGNAMIRTLLFRKPALALQSILGYYRKEKKDGVGNGGFSLRRIDKFIDITSDRKIKKLIATWSKQKRPYEDIFYCFVVPLYFKNFNIADIQTATRFSFETNPQKCYELNNRELPLGCHAWAKHDPSFWREVFESYGYRI